MSFLRKLLTRDEPKPRSFSPVDLGDQRGELPPEALMLAASGGSLDIVGESHYRSEIEAATGGPRTEGIRTTMWAMVVAEHDNPFDDHAVAVHLAGRMVGHLRRGDAAGFWPLIERIQVAGHPRTAVPISMAAGTALPRIRATMASRFTPRVRTLRRRSSIANSTGRPGQRSQLQRRPLLPAGR